MTKKCFCVAFLALMYSQTLFGVSYLDEKAQSWALANQNENTRTLAKIGNIYGDGLYIYPSVLVIGLFGLTVSSDSIARFSLILFESLLLSGAITILGKYTIHRHRPNKGDGADSYDRPSTSEENLSFPSGHTSNAWSVSTIIASTVDFFLWDIFWYGLAGVTGYARMHDDKHWLTDVLAGAAVGYLSAKLILYLNRSSNTTAYIHYVPPTKMDPGRGIALALQHQF